MMHYVLSNELYHHGIKGQHWGERRYQNPDGSYTEEGKKRYGIGSNGKISSREGVNTYFRDKYGWDGSAKSNKEIRKKVNAERKEYEKDYRQQMANRVKTKESKQDVRNRLREKYGDIEYQTFEGLRQQRSLGKKLLAAGVAALSVAGIAAIAAEKVRNGRQKAAEDAATVNMYDRTFANAKRNQNFRPSDTKRWKNAGTGERMYFNNNPHMTRNQQIHAALNPFYDMRTVTRSTPMRSRDQAMQYAPKSNSFTRSSNGLRRKYNPSWY